MVDLTGAEIGLGCDGSLLDDGAGGLFYSVVEYPFGSELAGPTLVATDSVSGSESVALVLIALEASVGLETTTIFLTGTQSGLGIDSGLVNATITGVDSASAAEIINQILANDTATTADLGASIHKAYDFAKGTEEFTFAPAPGLVSVVITPNGIITMILPGDSTTTIILTPDGYDTITLSES